MTPAETGRPTGATAQAHGQRRYAPAMTSPSDVSTRGGVSAWIRPMGPTLAPADELVIHVVCARDVVELREGSGRMKPSRSRMVSSASPVSGSGQLVRLPEKQAQLASEGGPSG